MANKHDLLADILFFLKGMRAAGDSTFDVNHEDVLVQAQLAIAQKEKNDNKG